MKAKIPQLKAIPGIPRDFAEELKTMPDEMLDAITAGFNREQAALVAHLSDEQLQALAEGSTEEGRALMVQLEALENG